MKDLKPILLDTYDFGDKKIGCKSIKKRGYKLFIERLIKKHFLLYKSILFEIVKK